MLGSEIRKNETFIGINKGSNCIASMSVIRIYTCEYLYIYTHNLYPFLNSVCLTSLLTPYPFRVSRVCFQYPTCMLQVVFLGIHYLNICWMCPVSIFIQPVC